MSTGFTGGISGKGRDPGDLPPPLRPSRARTNPQSYSHQLPELADTSLWVVRDPNSTLRSPRYIAAEGSLQRSIRG